ncbi:OmpA family protein [Vibrio hippocampi]|uniref:Peptidoglycan-associated lipoprotein n=1 Tax=Vibrio hippocampi TaxID=654686 RepID=A0ABN8DJJ8_9VIBR|nr:OmpA family protein [Vibrio hippocampi]CAH0529504.1 Peptidoglycan-associated lipoprotein [Vibrio hippocampi]
MQKNRLWLLSLTCFTSSVLADNLSEQITEYCDAKGYEYSHTIQVGEVHGVATHRQGYMQINDSSNDPELRAQLARLSALITEQSDCLTYISNLGIASFDQSDDKGNLVARVQFDFDKYQLTPLANRVLSQVAAQLATTGVQVVVEGHTDWVGSDAYNQALGLKRAEATAAKLYQQGVEKQNTTIKSLGENEPIASNKTQQGRSQNRRADVYIPNLETDTKP